MALGFLVTTACASAALADDPIVDVRAHWPNAHMAPTHYLSGNGIEWRINNISGNFDVFSVTGPGASDFYMWDSLGRIYTVRAEWNNEESTGVISVKDFSADPPPRFIDVDQLPRTVTERGSQQITWTAHTGEAAGVEQTATHNFESSYTLSRDGDRIKGHWTLTGETLWIGPTPVCDEPGRFEPGLVRYKNPHWDIDTELCWKRK
jgi:hypothetical protein